MDLLLESCLGSFPEIFPESCFNIAPCLKRLINSYQKIIQNIIKNLYCPSLVKFLKDFFTVKCLSWKYFYWNFSEPVWFQTRAFLYKLNQLLAIIHEFYKSFDAFHNVWAVSLNISKPFGKFWHKVVFVSWSKMVFQATCWKVSMTF